MEEEVKQAGDLLQQITDFARTNGGLDERVRFPRRYLRTACPIQSKLTSFVRNQTLRKNISYSYILLDVFRWLLNITDIDHMAKSMLIKNCIELFTAMCESMTKASAVDVMSKKKSKKFNPRIQEMIRQGIITPKLGEDLIWLWKKRDGVHLYLLEEPADGQYKYRDYKKAQEVTEQLLRELATYFRLSPPQSHSHP